MSESVYEQHDRREVNAAFDAAFGKKLVGIETTRAFGYPSDECGSLTLIFEDEYRIELRPTGWDADAISVTLKG